MTKLDRVVVAIMCFVAFVTGPILIEIAGKAALAWYYLFGGSEWPPRVWRMGSDNPFLVGIGFGAIFVAVVYWATVVRKRG